MRKRLIAVLVQHMLGTTPQPKIQFWPTDCGPIVQLPSFQPDISRAGKDHGAIEVTGDWLPDTLDLPALQIANSWNGWAQPAFTKEVIDTQLVPYMEGLRYDARLDAYEFYEDISDPNTQVHLFKAVIQAINGHLFKVYPVGAGFWCWRHAS